MTERLGERAKLIQEKYKSWSWVACIGTAAVELAVLDSPVYRSCPECGGSRVLATGPPLNIGEPCPACADAPVAIVSAALREKAIDACFAADQAALSRLQKQGFPDIPRVSTAETCPVDIRPIVEAEVDAVLSTVLGRPVRYAKDWRSIGRLRLGFQEDTPMLDVGDGTARELDGDEHIAILEDVDSTDTSAAHVESAATILEEAGKESDK